MEDNYEDRKIYIMELNKEDIIQVWRVLLY